MSTILLKIVPQLLVNPDLDIRYVLPSLIVERSGGVIQDDGYDYTSDAQALLLFLVTDQVEAALSQVIGILQNVPVLGNDLREAVIVAVALNDTIYRIAYPPEQVGQSFTVS